MGGGWGGSRRRPERPEGLYGPDLAFIHDQAFSGFARRAAPGVLRLLRRGGVAGGLVVDLGCGSGIWARELLDAGYDVLGLDVSGGMLALARRRAPGARLRRESFLEADLPTCDAVTALGECLGYTLDERAGPRSLGALFRRVHAALRPGGLFLFDVAEPGRGIGATHRAWKGPGWEMFAVVEEDPGRRLLTRRITTFRRAGALYRRSEEVHRLRLFSGAELGRSLRASGFRARTLRGYGGMRFPRGLVGLLARKP